MEATLIPSLISLTVMNLIQRCPISSQPTKLSLRRKKKRW